MKFKRIIKNPFFVSVILFVFAIILVSPWGNHVVNDDWDFYTHTRFFMEGNYSIAPPTDTALILQALIGAIWSRVWGLSLIKLRVLTLLFSLASILGAYKILKLFKVKKGITLLTLLTIVFNPLFFTSSLSYMTEIYFLFFVLWSLYFFLLFLKDDLVNKNLAISLLLAGGSLLIRQFGLVLFVAYFLVLVFLSWKRKSFMWLKFLFLFLSFLCFIAILVTWPRVSTAGDSSSTLFLAEDSEIESMLKLTPYLPGYFIFFLSPLILGLVFRLNNKVKIGSAFLAMFLAVYFYRMDVFPMGNVFYLERFYGKSNFDHYMHLFDNIPFKVFVAWYISFLLIGSVILLVRKATFLVKNIKFEDISPSVSVLFLSLLGMISIVFLSVFVAGDFYDRYFINAFILLAIFIGITIRKPFYTNASLIGLIFFVLITTFLSWDFYSAEEMRWKMGRKLQDEQGTNLGIFVNGSFKRYMHMSTFDAPDEYEPIGHGTLNYECFIQFYSRERNPNLLYKILHRFENSRTLNAYIKNPEIYGNKPTAGVEPLGWNWDDIFYEETYYSPIFAFLGIEPVLAAYCHD